MSTTVYETSIGELCKRLDELSRGVSDEFAKHQERVQMLRESADDCGDPAEVRGAVLASAFALLEAVEGLQTQVAEVREIITEQQQLLNFLHEESRTDVLTGRWNRRAFDEELTRRCAECKRTAAQLGLVLVDIDHFKEINDTYGHAAGDKVLKGVANVLSNSLREMDIVARYGGEEFALLLPNTNLLNACRAAERARTAVANSVFRCDEHELSVTISAGVTVVAVGTEDVMKRADDALYAAKQAGRNRVYAFQDGDCRPLHQEPLGEPGSDRRRWMRFSADDMDVQFRSPGGVWRAAHVNDESLIGLGVVVCGELALELGDSLEVEYCGDIRNAQVIFIKADDDANHARVGLRWCDADC